MFSSHSTTHHDHHDDQAVEERPDSVIEEPLVLPLRLEELGRHQVGESDVVDGGEHDDDHNDIAQLQEHLELGRLLLVLETVDSVQQRLQDPEVEHGVDQRRGDDAPQLHVGGGGEGRGDGVPQGEHEVDDAHENDADVGFSERRTRDAESSDEAREKRQPHGDDQREAASDRTRDGADEERDDGDGGHVGAGGVVGVEVLPLHDHVDQEGDEDDGDHVVDAHKLIGEADAAEEPDDDENDVDVQKDTREGECAVETGGNVSIGVHHHRVSGDIEIRCGRVAHGENHVVLSFNRNIVVHCDVQRTATTCESLKRSKRHCFLDLHVRLLHAWRNDKVVQIVTLLSLYVTKHTKENKAGFIATGNLCAVVNISNVIEKLFCCNVGLHSECTKPVSTSIVPRLCKLGIFFFTSKLSSMKDSPLPIELQIRITPMVSL